MTLPLPKTELSVKWISAKKASMSIKRQMYSSDLSPCLFNVPRIKNLYAHFESLKDIQTNVTTVLKGTSRKWFPAMFWCKDQT
jgi:hypothetical protein